MSEIRIGSGSTSLRGPSLRYLALLLVLTAGCTRAPSTPRGLEGIDEISARQSIAEGRDPPCDLLAPVEIEAVINSSVQAPQLAGRPVIAGMKMCSMVGAAGRSESRGQSLSAADQGLQGSVATWGLMTGKGRGAFEEYRSVNKRDLDSGEVDGRQEAWDRRLRTLLVLHDEGRLFAIRLTVHRLPLGQGEDRDSYLRDSARTLAERAIKRAATERNA